MIRKFELADLPEILKIEHKAFPKTAYNKDIFRYFWQNYPETFLVYVSDNSKVVGYIIYTDRGHVISIAVAPSHRRRKIGTKLMRIVLRTVGYAEVEVRRSNRVAIAFYQKLGFKCEGKIPNYYGDEDALFYTWRKEKR